MERMNTAPKRVRTIPATVQPLNVYSTEYLLKRVAAYCRVSTKQEEQLNSYETQVRYYTDRINQTATTEEIKEALDFFREG